MQSKLESRLIFLILGLTFLLYIPTLSYPFLTVDDPQYIYQNPLVVHPDLIKILSPSTLTVYDWTPLVTICHAIEFRLFGTSPFVYRLIHLMLYILSIYAAYRFLLNLKFSTASALLCVSIFALHPLNTEIVGWLSCRKNILSFLFGVVFINFTVKKKFYIAYVFLLLSLMSKGTSTAFVPIALAVFLLAASRSKPLIRYQAFLWFLIYFITAVVRGLHSLSSQLEVIQQRSSANLDLVDRMSIMGRVAIRQLRQFFFPNDLSLIYGWREQSWGELKVWASWMALIILFSLLLVFCRHSKKIWIGAAILVIGYLPTMNITPAPLFQADRYFQISLFGLCIIFSEIITAQRPVLTKLTAVWILGLLLPFSYLRLSAWKDTESVWQTIVLRHPNFAPARLSLGEELYRLRRIPEAKKSIEKAIELDPNSSYPKAKYQELFTD